MVNEHPFLKFLIEAATTGMVFYTTAHPDLNLAAAFWLAIWKTARTVAQAAGRLGMRAEVRYFETVKL